MVRILCCQCWGPRFYPCLGNWIPRATTITQCSQINKQTEILKKKVLEALKDISECHTTKCQWQEEIQLPCSHKVAQHPVEMRIFLLQEREHEEPLPAGWSRAAIPQGTFPQFSYHSSQWELLDATGTETKDVFMEAKQLPISINLCDVCLMWLINR